MTSGVPFNGDLAPLIGDEEIDSEVESGPPPAVIHILVKDPAAAQTGRSKVIVGNVRRRPRVQLSLQTQQMAPLHRDQGS